MGRKIKGQYNRVTDAECIFCNGRVQDFILLNADTFEYSGLMISFHHSGILRVRVLDDEGKLKSQDTINVRCCPKCGRTL